MITRITILAILLLPFLCLGQYSELELTIENSIFSDKIDIDYIKLLIEIDQKYENRTPQEIRNNDVSLFDHRVKFYTNQLRKSFKSKRKDPRITKLYYLYSFFSQIQISSANEFKATFMRKPSFDDMLGIYLIQWLGNCKQGISYENGKKVYKNHSLNEEEVIVEAIEFLDSEEKLIEYYYSFVLGALRRLGKSTIDNVNLDNIGLNHKEQSYIYYIVINRHAVGIISICAYGKKSKVEKKFNLIPTFNGKHFTEFKPYIYEDEVKMELYNKVMQCYQAIQNE